MLKGHNVPIVGEGRQYLFLDQEFSKAAAIAVGICVPTRNIGEVIALEDRSFDREKARLRAHTDLDCSFEATSKKGLDLVVRGTLAAREWLLKNEGNADALVHCASIKHSRLLADCFAGRGLRVVEINSKLSKAERQIAIRELPHADVILGVGCLSRGFDFPPIRLSALAFCTKSLSRYIQAIDRGCRAIGSKQFNWLLDFGGNIAALGDPDSAPSEIIARCEAEIVERTVLTKRAEAALEERSRAARAVEERKTFLKGPSRSSLSAVSLNFIHEGSVIEVPLHRAYVEIRKAANGNKYVKIFWFFGDRQSLEERIFDNQPRKLRTIAECLGHSCKDFYSFKRLVERLPSGHPIIIGHRPKPYNPKWNSRYAVLGIVREGTHRLWFKIPSSLCRGPPISSLSLRSHPQGESLGALCSLRPSRRPSCFEAA